MYTLITSFDIQSKLHEILKLVKQGRRYTITIKGVPVADLIPSQGVDFPIAIEKRSEVKHALDELHD